MTGATHVSIPAPLLDTSVPRYVLQRSADVWERERRRRRKRRRRRRGKEREREKRGIIVRGSVL